MGQKFNKYSRGAYDAIVYIDGSEVVAEDSNGRKIASGVAGTDDATVIQVACNIGGNIIVKPGNYTFTSTVTLGVPWTSLHGLHTPSIVSLKTSTKQVTISTTAGETFPAITITRSNISVSGFNFEPCFVGIAVVPAVTTMFGLFIEDNSFYDTVSKAIVIDSTTYSIVGPIRVNRNIFYSLASGSVAYIDIICASGKPITALYINENIFESHATTYVNFDIAGTVELMSMKDNYMESNTTSETFYKFTLSGSNAYLYLYGDISGKIAGVAGDSSITMALTSSARVYCYGKIENMSISNADVVVSVASGCYIYNGPVLSNVILATSNVTITGVAIGAAIENSRIVNVTISGGRGIRIVNNTHVDGANFVLTNDTGLVFQNNQPHLYATSLVLSTTGSTNVNICGNPYYLTESSGSSTGTGSEQTIAHSLAAIPTGCKAWIKIEYPVGSGRYITKDIPFDATNVYPTVDNGVAFEWGIA
jgi:hypothetical protein